MDYKIEVRPLATLEIIEAFDWYETGREGLGVEFLSEINAFYDSLLRNPLTYSFLESNIRQGRLDRFPYLVVYEVFENSIVVYSVFMAKQIQTRKGLFKLGQTLNIKH